LAPLIELRHVSKLYLSPDGGPPVTVLDDINLEVREGEMLALLGQSGSGKSTILRLMAGLTDPTQGVVFSRGAPLTGVNRGLAIVFQSFALYPWLTVEQNVLTAENLRTEVVDLWRDSTHAGLKSIFLVTHNIVEAIFMATRIVIISSHPGRIQNVIVNPLPYPRNVNTRQFAALVDQVHAAITALVLPDEPAEQIAARPAGAVAAGAPQEVAAAATRIEAIPNAPVETIVGLLEILEDSQETMNVFDLSARIGKEFGETIAIVKAAEMLDLVDTPKDDVVMTQTGWYFLAAPAAVRKTLFRQAIMKLRLFQMLTSRLAEAPNGRLDADIVLEELARLLPYDQPSKLFQTLIAWGRYAEVIDFDQNTNEVGLHAAADDDQDDDEASR
jgi:NitT/TauT family transport system ATP-binding protein